MRFLSRLALLLVFALPIAAHASETRAEHAANEYAQQELSSSPRLQNLPDYSLKPADLTKAQHLDSVLNVYVFVGQIWDVVAFMLLLWLGVVAWMRGRALAAGAGLRARQKPTMALWVEGFTFGLLFVAIFMLLELPLQIYGHHISMSYGFSIQHWPSWLGDKLKTLVIEGIITSLLFLLLHWVIRKFPRSYWIVFWVVLAPIVVFMLYLAPIVVDPLFNKFEPLAKTQPQLVQRLSQVVARGNMNIPPERMFLMKASAKTTTLNAYVSGFGGSKRLVLWDTSLDKLTPDQILLVFGHESGHYVLHHILEGTAMAFFGLFIGFFIAFHTLQGLLKRFGARWRISSQDDWGALVVLMFVVTVLSTLGAPIVNTFSRHIEHEADIYGQEAVHGIVADPQDTTRTAMNVLGESYLEAPNPYPFFVVWQYNHPSTSYRAAFGKAYDPWALGMEPKYFKKQ